MDNAYNIEIDNENLEKAPEYPRKEAKRAYKITGAALFALIITVQLTVAVLSVVVRVAFPELVSTEWFLIVFNFVCLYGLGTPVYFFVIRGAKPEIPEKKKMTTGAFVVAAIIAVGLIFSLNFVTVAVIAALEEIFDITINSNVDAMLGGSNLILAAVSTVIVAPILEEIFFRRMLCDRLARYGEWQAVVFSAFAFAMFHTSLNQILYAFGLGCLFGIIYVRTRKLRYTVILHAIVNFVGSVPGLLMMKYGVEDVVYEYSSIAASGDMDAMVEFATENAIPLFFYLLYVVVLIGVTVAGFVLLMASLKKLARAVDGSYMPKGKRFSTMYSGVLTVLYFVVCIALTVASIFIV